MSFVLRGVVVSAVVVASASVASADPPKKKAPQTVDTCVDGFSCGALAARSPYPEALRAAKRAVAFDKLFEGQYASMLIHAGPKRGGDPARGLAMLEVLCKAQQARTVSIGGGDGHSMAYDQTDCMTLAREYKSPPSESGLSPDGPKAERIYRAECTRGDSSMCGSLGDLYLMNLPGVPRDTTKARAAMQEGCDMTGKDPDLVGPYAAGICGSLGEALYKGKLGAKDSKAALPILEKACANGYRCDLLVTILADGDGVPADLDKAKTAARKICDAATGYCGPMETIASKDPAWAKENYRQLCEDRKTPRQEACRGYERMGGVPKVKTAVSATSPGY